MLKRIIRRIIRASFDARMGAWVFKLHLGPGAGYGSWVLNRRVFVPTGWTLWVGHNVRGGRGDMYRPRPVSVGITRNGNAVPYIAH